MRKDLWIKKSLEEDCGRKITNYIDEESHHGKEYLHEGLTRFMLAFLTSRLALKDCSKCRMNLMWLKALDKGFSYVDMTYKDDATRTKIYEVQEEAPQSDEFITERFGTGSAAQDQPVRDLLRPVVQHAG